jgi:uncharacterized protein YaeQ
MAQAYLGEPFAKRLLRGEDPQMALSATIRRFHLSVSDVDRAVYETLEFQVAQHPSESEPYLVTRVLAMALEHREGLVFGRGLSNPEEPGLSAPSEHGGVALWIEIGQPSAARLHKITKQADDVRVYSHKKVEGLIAELDAESVHRREEITIIAFEPSFLDGLCERLTRNNTWELFRTDGVVYLTVDGTTLETTPTIYGPA